MTNQELEARIATLREGISRIEGCLSIRKDAVAVMQKKIELDEARIRRMQGEIIMARRELDKDFVKEIKDTVEKWHKEKIAQAGEFTRNLRFTCPQCHADQALTIGSDKEEWFDKYMVRCGKCGAVIEDAQRFEVRDEKEQAPCQKS